MKWYLPQWNYQISWHIVSWVWLTALPRWSCPKPKTRSLCKYSFQIYQTRIVEKRYHEIEIMKQRRGSDLEIKLEIIWPPYPLCCCLTWPPAPPMHYGTDHLLQPDTQPYRLFLWKDFKSFGENHLGGAQLWMLWPFSAPRAHWNLHRSHQGDHTKKWPLTKFRNYVNSKKLKCSLENLYSHVGKLVRALRRVEQKCTCSLLVGDSTQEITDKSCKQC